MPCLRRVLLCCISLAVLSAVGCDRIARFTSADGLRLDGGPTISDLPGQRDSDGTDPRPLDGAPFDGQGGCADTNPLSGTVNNWPALSDDFERPSIDCAWRAINASPESAYEIASGALRMRRSKTRAMWFGNEQSLFVFKPLVGNFVATTRVLLIDGDTGAPPSHPFDAAGLLLRAPVGLGENWESLALGVSSSGAFGVAARQTRNSVTARSFVPLSQSRLDLRICRIGDEIYTYYRATDQLTWNYVSGSERPDLPSVVDVGLQVSGDVGTNFFAFVEYIEFASPTALDCPQPSN